MDQQGEGSEPEDGEILDEQSDETAESPEVEGEYEHGKGSSGKRHPSRKGAGGSHGRSRVESHRRSQGRRLPNGRNVSYSRSRSGGGYTSTYGYNRHSKRHKNFSQHFNKRKRSPLPSSSRRASGSDNSRSGTGGCIPSRHTDEHSQNPLNSDERLREPSSSQSIQSCSENLPSTSRACVDPPLVVNDSKTQDEQRILSEGTDPVSDDDDDDSVQLIPDEEVAAGKKPPLIITLDETDSSDDEGSSQQNTSVGRKKIETIEEENEGDRESSGRIEATATSIPLEGTDENVLQTEGSAEVGSNGMPVQNHAQSSIAVSEEQGVANEGSLNSVDTSCSENGDQNVRDILEEADDGELQLRARLIGELLQKSESKKQEDKSDEEETALREVLISQMDLKKRRKLLEYEKTGKETEHDHENTARSPASDDRSPPFSIGRSSSSIERSPPSGTERSPPSPTGRSSPSLDRSRNRERHFAKTNRSHSASDKNHSRRGKDYFASTPTSRRGTSSSSKNRKDKNNRQRLRNRSEDQSYQPSEGSSPSNSEAQHHRMVRVSNEPLRNPPHLINRPANIKNLPEHDLRNKLLRNRRNEQQAAQDISVSSLSSLFPEFGVADTDMRQEAGVRAQDNTSDMTIRRTVNFDTSQLTSTATSSSTAITYMAPLNVDIPLPPPQVSSQIISPLTRVQNEQVHHHLSPYNQQPQSPFDQQQNSPYTQQQQQSPFNQQQHSPFNQQQQSPFNQQQHSPFNQQQQSPYVQHNSPLCHTPLQQLPPGVVNDLRVLPHSPANYPHVAPPMMNPQSSHPLGTVLPQPDRPFRTVLNTFDYSGESISAPPVYASTAHPIMPNQPVHSSAELIMSSGFRENPRASMAIDIDHRLAQPLGVPLYYSGNNQISTPTASGMFPGNTTHSGFFSPINPASGVGPPQGPPSGVRPPLPPPYFPQDRSQLTVSTMEQRTGHLITTANAEFVSSLQFTVDSTTRTVTAPEHFRTMPNSSTYSYEPNYHPFNNHSHAHGHLERELRNRLNRQRLKRARKQAASATTTANSNINLKVCLARSPDPICSTKELSRKQIQQKQANSMKKENTTKERLGTKPSETVSNDAECSASKENQPISNSSDASDFTPMAQDSTLETSTPGSSPGTSQEIQSPSSSPEGIKETTQSSSSHEIMKENNISPSTSYEVTKGISDQDDLTTNAEASPSNQVRTPLACPLTENTSPIQQPLSVVSAPENATVSELVIESDASLTKFSPIGVNISPSHDKIIVSSNDLTPLSSISPPGNDVANPPSEVTSSITGNTSGSESPLILTQSEASSESSASPEEDIGSANNVNNANTLTPEHKKNAVTPDSPASTDSSNLEVVATSHPGNEENVIVNSHDLQAAKDNECVAATTNISEPVVTDITETSTGISQLAIPEKKETDCTVATSDSSASKGESNTTGAFEIKERASVASDTSPDETRESTSIPENKGTTALSSDLQKEESITNAVASSPTSESNKLSGVTVDSTSKAKYDQSATSTDPLKSENSDQIAAASGSSAVDKTERIVVPSVSPSSVNNNRNVSAGSSSKPNASQQKPQSVEVIKSPMSRSSNSAGARGPRKPASTDRALNVKDSPLLKICGANISLYNTRRSASTPPPPDSQQSNRPFSSAKQSPIVQNKITRKRIAEDEPTPSPSKRPPPKQQPTLPFKQPVQNEKSTAKGGKSISAKLPTKPQLPLIQSKPGFPGARKPLQSKTVIPIVVPIADGDTTEDEEDEDGTKRERHKRTDGDCNNENTPSAPSSDPSNPNFHVFLDIFLKNIRKNVDKLETQRNLNGSKKLAANPETDPAGTTGDLKPLEKDNSLAAVNAAEPLNVASKISDSTGNRSKAASPITIPTKDSVGDEQNLRKMVMQKNSSPVKPSNTIPEQQSQPQGANVKQTSPPQEKSESAVIRKRQASPTAAQIAGPIKKKPTSGEPIGTQSTPRSSTPTSGLSSAGITATRTPCNLSVATSGTGDTSVNPKAVIESLTQRITETRDQVQLSTKEKELLTARQQCYDEYRNVLTGLQQHTRLSNYDNKLGQEISELEKKLEALKKKKDTVNLKALDINRAIREKSKAALTQKKTCLVLTTEVKTLGDKLIGEKKYKVPDILMPNINEIIRSLKVMDSKQSQDLQRERGVAFKQLVFDEGGFSTTSINTSGPPSNNAPSSHAFSSVGSSTSGVAVPPNGQQRKPEPSTSKENTEKLTAESSRIEKTSDGLNQKASSDERVMVQSNAEGKKNLDGKAETSPSKPVGGKTILYITRHGAGIERAEGKQSEEPRIVEDDRLPLLRSDVMSATVWNPKKPSKDFNVKTDYSVFEAMKKIGHVKIEDF